MFQVHAAAIWFSSYNSWTFDRQPHLPWTWCFQLLTHTSPKSFCFCQFAKESNKSTRSMKTQGLHVIHVGTKSTQTGNLDWIKDCTYICTWYQVNHLYEGLYCVHYCKINKWISTFKSTKVQRHRLTHTIEHEGVVATEFKSFVLGHDVKIR